MKHNIILIGFMGSGKTCVGACLAEKLSYRFLDTDQMIEQSAGTSISNIFEVHGEEFFRNLETDLLKDMLEHADQVVISTGGGLPVREQNTEILKMLGYVIYLKASKDTTVRRLRGDTTRPLLQGEGLDQRVDRMLKTRIPIYEKAAHEIIVTDHKTIDQIVSDIIEAYWKRIS